MVVGMVLIFGVAAVMPSSDAADPAESQAIAYPMVEPGRKLAFPRDHGAHPDYRTEWWYITGWIENDGVARGFQVTFFRSRPGLQEDNESAFAPKQLIFAHAAIADAANGRLIYDERRFGLEEQKQQDETRERVELLMRFEGSPGLFLLHCHNLEHEDAGMMLNMEVL